ncbi:MAG: hypothetical protein H0X43_07750 [Nitrosospira sp.]|nr:hypothetical protein [Nitrosospira sp.]
MLSYVRILILASFAWSSCILAQTQATPFVHEKTYWLPSGKKVAVTFRERHCESGECREVDAGMWGMDGGVPRLVTATFLVLIDGREFVIPKKFYRDLTNTYYVNVFEQKGLIVVKLKGGTAAGAYTASFTLGGICGFERKICGEVCNEIWEHIIWYNSFTYEDESRCKSGIQ